MAISSDLEDLLRPSYSIYRYTDQIYKVNHFKGDRIPRVISRENHEHYDSKLDSAIARARRVILEIALCNDWAWFATLTISPEKFDRSNLAAWDQFLKQWIRDKRKQYGHGLPYLLIPEPHANGCWHLHGFFSQDLSPHLESFRTHIHEFPRLPRDLLEGDFYFWRDYMERFGFCSFGRIRNKVACSFYVTKYISKCLDDTLLPLGAHLYTASQGLNRAELHGHVQRPNTYLDQFCKNVGEFVDTGFTHLDHGLDWTFALEHMALQPLEDVPDDHDIADEYSAFEQLLLYGFSE